MLNVPATIDTPAKPVTPPVSIEQATPISAPTNAVVQFETASISSTPAPVAPVAEPQSDETTTPESAPIESPVVKPVAPVAKKTTPTIVPAAATANVPATTQAPAAPVIGSVSGLGSRIASAALAQLGVDQDCTMLVTNSLAAVGIHFHGWPAGYLSLGRTVPASQAQPGDLVYYQNGGMGLAHIAVYIGNGQAVHGGWNGFTTAIASVNIGSGPVFIRVGG